MRSPLSRRSRFGTANRRRTRSILFALVALTCTGVALITYATSLLATLEGTTIDARFSIRGPQRAPSNIVIVGIDDATLSTLSAYQWPFPRRVEGELINRINSQHPAAIAFDVEFAAMTDVNRDEVPFLDAIYKTEPPGIHAPRIVFSTTETEPNGDSQFLGESADGLIKQGVPMRIGNGNFVVDPGDIYRRMVYSLGGLKAFAVVAAEAATHRTVPRSSFQGRTVYIDYVGPAFTFHYVPYVTALRGKLPSNFFRGKIVVVGAVAPVLQDIHATSTDPLMPGPEIQANAIETVLRGLPLIGAPGWVNIVLIVLLGTAIPLITFRFGTLAATSVAFALAAGYTIAVQLAFNAGLVVAFVYPMLALVLSGAGSLSVQLVSEAIERIRVRDLFGRFVPANVVDEVLANADGLRLGGVQRDGTVMFSDLRGFTSFAESLTPAQVIETLNHYLSEMSDAILDHGGTLVAYMGDGIMAVFGAPLPQADHADRALQAAREMLEVRLPRFNKLLRDAGLGDGFRMGIGLNSGHVMSGNVGSERRVEYTAVGDTTNSASRIEGMTKGTPHMLLLSDATKNALTSPVDDLVFFDEVDIRGRLEKLKLWSIPEVEPGIQPEPLQATPPAV